MSRSVVVLILGEPFGTLRTGVGTCAAPRSPPARLAIRVPSPGVVGDALPATDREFERATHQGKTRLVYVKGTDDKGRHPKMAALIRQAGDQLIRRRFGGIDDLKSAVYASLVDELTARGVVSDKPFDERSSAGASLADLDADVVASFVHLARAKRDFPLAEDTPVHDVLTHHAGLGRARGLPLAGE